MDEIKQLNEEAQRNYDEGLKYGKWLGVKAERNRVIEMLEGMKSSGTLVPSGCPDGQGGCLVYHQELRMTEADKVINLKLDSAIKNLKETK